MNMANVAVSTLVAGRLGEVVYLARSACLAICPGCERIDRDQSGTILRTLEHLLNICKGPAKKAMQDPEI